MVNRGSVVKIDEDAFNGFSTAAESNVVVRYVSMEYTSIIVEGLVSFDCSADSVDYLYQ